MKRRVLIILLLLCCSIGYADVQNTDVHLLKLVQAINDSDYIGIKREIPLVENWYYDKWNEKAWIEKIHVAFEFLESDETKDIEPHLLDSLWLYAGAEMEQRGNDYLSLDWTEENFREAIYNYEIAASIYREILGEQEPAYHSLLSKIAIYYSEIGQKIQSALYQIEYLKIQIRISTEPNHVLYSNLAENYEYVFDFKQAEMCYLQALSILEDQSMIHSKEYAKCLQLFANMYIDLGDYEKAVYYILQAIPIREELYGTHSMEYAIPVMTLAIIYGRLEDIPMQRKYTEIAASIYNNLYGEESREYANALIALADLYMHEKDTTKTILALEKSISILKHHSDEESRMELAIALSNLGLIHTYQGNYMVAEEHIQKSIEIAKPIEDNNEFYFMPMLSNLGYLYYSKGEYEKAEHYYEIGWTLSKQLFVQSVGFMSERQRKLYWKQMAGVFERGCPALSYRMFPAKSSIAGFAYDNELFKKGLLLSSGNAIRQSVLESGDTTLTRQWEELTRKKQQIMVLEEKGTMPDYLTTLRREAEGLEKAIIGSSAAYRENMRQWNITWDSVRAELKPNEVAIEFMTAPLNADSTMYCALLLRDTCSYPILIPLFEQNEVAGLVDVSMPASLGRVYAYSGYGKQLSQIVWKKIMPYIQANEAVYFAPTGVLHQLAIENLPYDATHTMSDVYQMVRVSSTRELALHKPALPHQKAALYGGIFYEADATDLLVASMPYHRSVTAPVSVDSLERSLAQYLPATKTEVEQIRQTLKTKNIDVHIYSAIDGNEESFKALSGQRQNVLHLATHGFFRQDATATIDPMERSGLLLAGANLALSGHPERIPEGVEDGILTAKEISVLDFRNADIVVLSACETAKGDVSGEGVFGLQRAFKMAGAQTILMALWRVDDEATQILMAAFYRYYSKGMTKRQAFRKAQEEVRHHAKTKRVDVPVPTTAVDKYKNKGKVSTVETTKTTYPYESPYYWAGFILLD